MTALSRAMPRLRLVLTTLYGGRLRAALLGAALSGAATLAGVALLGTSGWFVAAGALAGLTAAAMNFDIFAPSAGVRFLALLRTAARYGERLATHDVTLRALAALRVRLFRGFAVPGAATALLARPARLSFRLMADVDALDTLYLRALVPIGAALATAAAVGLWFGLIDPVLGLGTAGFLLLAGLGIPLIVALTAKKPLRRRLYALEALRVRTVDLAAGQTDLLTVGRLDAAKAAAVNADARLADADDAVNRLDVWALFAFHAAGAALLAGLVLATAALGHGDDGIGGAGGGGKIDAPTAALILLAGFAAMEPFAALRRGALELGRALAATERLAPRLAPELASSVPLAVPATPPEPPFRLRPGERAALIGPSGAGKTTLLARLAGNDPAAAGIGLLTQRAELFQDSLRDNLRLAAPSAADPRLWEALTAAGLAADAARLPGGLDARLGEGGVGLSAGQARRLALARLLLRDPALWLLDEPTESLDGPTARDLLARLDATTKGRALVVATHARREAELADTLMIVEQGRIVAAINRGEPEFDAALRGLRPD